MRLIVLALLLLAVPVLAITGSGTMSGGTSMGPPVVAPPPSAGVEARCTALGVNCICSEPMAAFELAGADLTNGHNFSDSPPATDCYTAGGMGTSQWGSGAKSYSVTESGMPAANTVAYTVETDYFPNPILSYNQIVWARARGVAAAGDARVCIRHYFQVTDDWKGEQNATTPNCPMERNKLLQFEFWKDNNTCGTQLPVNCSPTYQMQSLSGQCTGPVGAPAPVTAFYTPMSVSLNEGGFGNPWLAASDASNVTWADCNVSNGWCRLEACVYGNLQTGANIQVDTRLTRLSDNKVFEYIGIGPWTKFNGLSMMALDLYHGQNSGNNVEPFDATGKRNISYFMQAAWDTNVGQWIGPATEVEGP